MTNCQGCAEPAQVVPVNIGFYIAPEDLTPIDGQVYEPGTKVPIVLQLCPGCQRKDPESKDPFVRGIVKVGRNDPCPCGGGKKSKKCCG